MTDDKRLTTSNSLFTLREKLRSFAEERDWDQFHVPKNLAIALSVEASELLEHFQWLSEEDSKHLASAQLENVRHEMADVLLYLVRLADKLDVDLLEAALHKMELNAKKYPADKARGSVKSIRNSNEYGQQGRANSHCRAPACETIK